LESYENTRYKYTTDLWLEREDISKEWESEHRAQRERDKKKQQDENPETFR